MRLATVFLHVTKACSLRCRYCYFSAGTPMDREMKYEDFVQAWPGVVATAPRKIVFTGGEPLLRPDLLKIALALRAADQREQTVRALNTNGILMTRELALELSSVFHEVRVSIDGLAARNDALRGVGSFAAALGALDVLVDVGRNPKALVTVTRHTLPDLTDLICLLWTRGVRVINVNLFHPIGRGERNQGWQTTMPEVAEAMRCAGDRLGIELPSKDEIEQNGPHCGVGRYLNVLPNGDVYPCHVLTDPKFRCGNLVSEDFRDICSPGRPLYRLARMDFEALAKADECIEDAMKQYGCLGDIHKSTSGAKTWSELFPIVS